MSEKSACPIRVLKRATYEMRNHWLGTRKNAYITHKMKAEHPSNEASTGQGTFFDKPEALVSNGAIAFATLQP